MLERHNGSLIVSFDDDFRVTKPFNVSSRELGTIVVFIISFLGHYVPEDVFAFQVVINRHLRTSPLALA